MYVLSNIKKIYDGKSASKTSIRESVDIVVHQGKIKEINPHKKQSWGTDTPVIDCSHLTVTPGLIDCHGHITLLGVNESDMDLMNGNKGMFFVEKILFSTLVNGGVTTMRDIGGATHFMKRMVDEGLLIGPRLKIAICMLSTTGGHADFRGPDRCHAELSKSWPEMAGRPSSMVDGPWDCRKRVREIAACGADLIKICASPGIASPGDKLENDDFAAEEIEAICSEATARGLKVAAHAHSRNGIDKAIRYGVYDIQHISFMDEKLVEAAHKKGCTVTPTSWVISELVKSKDLVPAVREKALMAAEHHARAVEFASKGGLKILMGTDPVLHGMHGRNYMELSALVADGLSELAAWYGATGLAAQEIGQSDTGTLEVGQRADLLICREDVISDPRLFSKNAIVEVIKDGVGHRAGLAGIPIRRFESTVDQFVPRVEC